MKIKSSMLYNFCCNFRNPISSPFYDLDGSLVATNGKFVVRIFKPQTTMINEVKTILRHDELDK